jgi:hypothetical protein
MTTIHTPHPTSYAIPHPAKHTSIGKRVALAAIGTIGAAAALGAVVSAYTGSVSAQAVAVPAPAVAVVAPDTVANPPAVSAPDDTIQPVTAPGSTVITAVSCPGPIPPTKPGHQPVAYYTAPNGKPCVYPHPQQGGGGLTGVEGPGGGGVSSNPTLGGPDPDPLPPNDGGGSGGLNSCTNLDKTCHATQ